MTTPNIKAQKSSYFQGRKMWFWVAGGLGVVTLILLVVFLQSLISTTTYYVLNRDVAARTLVTTDMLSEVVTSQGGEPPTALSLAEVSTGEVFTKFNLSAGDILSSSNAGDLVPLGAGLPDNFVIASFTAAPNNAAGGNITRGDYVDVFYIDGEQGTQLIFQRMLIVDATSNVEGGGSSDETVATTEDTATAPYRVGVPTLYTVGLTQQDAAKLALASQGSLYVTISSADSAQNGVGEVVLGYSLADLLGNPAGDSGSGTDNTFSSSTSTGTNEGSTGTTPGSSSSPTPSDVTTVPPSEPVEGTETN